MCPAMQFAGAKGGGLATAAILAKNDCAPCIARRGAAEALQALTKRD
jgi:hypothetical protein